MQGYEPELKNRVDFKKILKRQINNDKKKKNTRIKLLKRRV